DIATIVIRKGPRLRLGTRRQSGGVGRVERSARDGPLEELARRALVRKEVALLERLVLRLVVHFLPAAGGEQQNSGGEQDGRTRSHSSTASTSCAPRPARNALT